ncbi:MAG: hypothetical protein OEZ08_09805, partial [Betaproteobacteria bacterium]|nr:hypothetical protein [Betaproteobacteria bacterium]
RRRVIAGGLLVFVPGVVRAACMATPRDALGPFYVEGAPKRSVLCASGSGGREPLIVSGRIVGLPDCAPLAGALVEVWQADAQGGYTQVSRNRRDDPNCLLRAALNTDGEGRYRFETILPSEYTGRPRHIHYRVSRAGYATLVTQMYFERGRGIPEALVASAKPDSKGVLSASFDVTLARE